MRQAFQNNISWTLRDALTASDTTMRITKPWNALFTEKYLGLRNTYVNLAFEDNETFDIPGSVFNITEDPPEDPFYLATLASFDESGTEIIWEIVKVVSCAPVEISDEVWRTNIGIERAQEGTTARNWPAGTKIEMRLTAGTLEALQKPDIQIRFGVNAMEPGVSALPNGWLYFQYEE